MIQIDAKVESPPISCAFGTIRFFEDEEGNRKYVEYSGFFKAIQLGDTDPSWAPVGREIPPDSSKLSEL